MEELTSPTCMRLLKDKAGRTALHLAAIKGRVHIIDELLSKCPQQKAIQQVTPLGETVLHLAVKNSQFGAFKVLFEASNKLEDHEVRLNAKDKEGNTVFEMAKARDQLQVLDFLNQQQSGDHIIKVKDNTTLDDLKVRPSYVKNLMKKSWRMYLKDKNLVPLMAAMIAAATFQAGLNPPPIIWEKGVHLDTKCMNIAHFFKNHIKDPFLLKSCPASRFYGFMVCNTLAFTSSLILIPYHQSALVAPIMIIISLYTVLLSYLIVLRSIFPTVSGFVLTDCVVLLSVLLLFGKPLVVMLTTLLQRYRNRKSKWCFLV